MAEPWVKRLRYAYWKGTERLWHAVHRAAYWAARYSEGRELLARFNARDHETEEQRQARRDASMAFLNRLRRASKEEDNA